MSRTASWPVRLSVVTWNVSTKYPENLTLNHLLGVGNSPQMDTDLPDLYAIGLQEVNSQPQNVIMGLFKEDPWTNKVRELLKIRDYVVIKTEQMQGLLLMVFAKRKHLLHLREVESEYTRTGLGGIWGNKGAVSIRMNVYGCSMCLVNAHLAAHDHMLEERISDYEKIVEEHKFHVKINRDIFSHDYVFWFGDLNFRLTGEATTTPEDIRALIEKDKLKELFEKDQLRLVMRQKRAFTELTERQPEFPPTFKFEHGTSDYDMKRRPAWTDRILHRVATDNFKNVMLHVEQTSYKSHPLYNLSDHKPVTSEFIIKVPKRLATVKRRQSTAVAANDTCYYLNDSIDNGQVYDDPTEMCIEFAPIQLWLSGEENVIDYYLPDSFEEAGSDWIGIYKEEFSSLEEYQSYEYTSRNRYHNNQPSTTVSQRRLMQLTFPETIDLPDNESYVLLYFQSTGTRGVTGLAGISAPFRTERRSPRVQLDSVD